eukprot:gb/GECH01005701.1/.p1 GENE.gb/GECH01005701.1/~~gb/GECH01005701.1/.p1  ORF type:complete len:123 (+),score=12.99 gb/GECH01005701.1/:1-369(+)
MLKRLEKLFLSQQIFPYRDEFHNLRKPKKTILSGNAESKGVQHELPELNFAEQADYESTLHRSLDEFWFEIQDLVTPFMYKDNPRWYSSFAEFYWFFFRYARHKLNRCSNTNASRKSKTKIL